MITYWFEAMARNEDTLIPLVMPIMITLAIALTLLFILKAALVVRTGVVLPSVIIITTFSASGLLNRIVKEN